MKEFLIKPFYKSKIKKHHKYIIIGIPILLSSLSIGIYYYIKKNQRKYKIKLSTTNKTKNNKFFDEKIDIFPIINQEEVYDLIRIKNGKPIINDEMIAKIFNLIIKKMQIIEGNIDYEINKISKKEVILKFIWHGPNNTYSQDYKIEIKI